MPASEDGLSYTFHLRDGVKFSDGSSFDPYDNGTAAPVGTCAWVLKEYQADQYALFERNEIRRD